MDGGSDHFFSFGVLQPCTTIRGALLVVYCWRCEARITSTPYVQGVIAAGFCRSLLLLLLLLLLLPLLHAYRTGAIPQQQQKHSRGKR